MPDVWSINTTIRNPERLQGFLRVLSLLEGEIFDEETQGLYQKELIRHKLFMPNATPEELKMEYENPEPFSDEDAEKIFSLVNDPAMRGRTSASRFNQMGLAIARKKKGPVVITDLGRDFLDDDFSKEHNFLFNYFVKWQLPNPLENGYADFDIKPFLATLYVINKVNDLEGNRKNKRKGISKNEFALFIIPMKKYTEIDDVCEEIIKYRDFVKESSDEEMEIFNEMLRKKAKEVFNVVSENEINKKYNNLRDYADSVIRWFRKTQYIIYRGSKRYVDISPSRLEQAKQLINTLSLSSDHYETEEEYMSYLNNKDLPVLPWETNIEDKKEVIINLGDLIKKRQDDIDSNFPNRRQHDFIWKPTFLPSQGLSDLREMEVEFKQHLDTLTNEFTTLKESDLGNLANYITELNSLANLTSTKKKDKAPLCLEWYTSLSLMALDDSLEIKPNIVKADDGLPLFTAGGGVADIECFYESFNLIVEVTLIKSRAQLQNEVLPISRHFVDMKDKFLDKTCYCLFLAPFVHRDSLNYFYFFINNGFEGHDLNLIPLTIEQFTNLLNYVLINSNNGKLINHKKFEDFFRDTLANLKNENNTRNWQKVIDDSIVEWGESF